MMDKQTKNI